MNSPHQLLRLCIALILAISTFSLPAQASEQDIQTVSLSTLIETWSRIAFLNPEMSSQHEMTTHALARAMQLWNEDVPASLSINAVKALLNDLDSPGQRLFPITKQQTKSVQRPNTWQISGGILTVNFPQGIARGNIHFWETVRRQSANAEGLIFDLRASQYFKPETPIHIEQEFEDSKIIDIAWPGAISLPVESRVLYNGFPDEFKPQNKIYIRSTMRDADSQIIYSNARQLKPVIFLINQYSQLPRIAISLQEAGQAEIFSEIKDSRRGAVSFTTLLLNKGWIAEVDIGSLASKEEKASNVGAMQFKENFPKLVGVAKSMLPSSPQEPDSSSSGDAARRAIDARERRLAETIRLWWIVKHFYPATLLSGDRWERILIPTLQEVSHTNADGEYARVLEKMMSALNDSHVTVGSIAQRDFYGDAELAIDWTLIDRRLFITRVMPQDIEAQQMLTPGDEIIEIDSKTPTALIKNLRPYLSSSTPQAGDVRALWLLRRGHKGSTAHLKVKKADGRLLDVVIAFNMNLGGVGAIPERTTPVYFVMPGNIGYVDLSRLAIDNIDLMFETLKDTHALILDLRGTPRNTAWQIAGRLGEIKTGVIGKFVDQSLFSTKDGRFISYPRVTNLVVNDLRFPHFEKPVIALINEKTFSHGEHSVMILKAKTSVFLIGSPTQGVNGNITNACLSRYLCVGFTGAKITWPNGDTFQNKGIQPNLFIQPTQRGIQAGTDEVLEAAQQYATKEVSKIEE